MESELVFVGTGPTHCIPSLSHLSLSPPCPVCASSLSSAPHNKRNNTSLLISTCPSKTSKTTTTKPTTTTTTTTKPTNILIDCGKTFRSAFLHSLAPRKLSRLHSLLLTHPHSESCGGLDDIRDLLFFIYSPTFTAQCTTPLPTFLSPSSLDYISFTLKYIVDASNLVKQNREVVLPRRVTCLDFQMLGDDEKEGEEKEDKEEGERKGKDQEEENKKGERKIERIFPSGSENYGGFLAFPLHFVSSPSSSSCSSSPCPSSPNSSYGFAFGKQTKVVYISHTTERPSSLSPLLLSLPQPIDILIMNCHYLHTPKSNDNKQLSLDQVQEIVLEVRPKRVFCVGMSCELEHNTTNKQLEEWVEGVEGVDSMQLAYDGMTVPVLL